MVKYFKFGMELIWQNLLNSVSFTKLLHAKICLIDWFDTGSHNRSFVAQDRKPRLWLYDLLLLKNQYQA